MTELHALGWVIWFAVLYLAANQRDQDAGLSWFFAKWLAFIGVLCALVWWWPK